MIATVLVVDDSATDRALAGDLLRQSGFRVIYAVDGRDALRRIDDHELDVVLTDLRMPELDGLQLVETMRESHPHVPVILMTSDGSEKIAAEALRVGAANYVPKKFLAVELVKSLQEVFATIQALPEASLKSLLRSLESRFELGYEKNSLSTLVDHLQKSLADVGFTHEAELIRIGMALNEALNNAVEHGNLELDSALKESGGDAYDRLKAQRIRQAPYCSRRVRVTQRVAGDEVVFIVRDDGTGFDPSRLPDPTDPENLMKAGGRGMLLIRTFMDEVHFNEDGNEITMIKRRVQ